VISGEATQAAMNILRGQNPQSSVFAPTSGDIMNGLSKAGIGIPSASSLISKAGGMPSIGGLASKAGIPNINSQLSAIPSSVKSFTKGLF